VTYEPPTIEQRAEVDGPVIGFQGGSPPFQSPAWRRTDDELQEESP
jgi:hypothetical protein